MAKKEEFSGSEKRKSERRPILDSFSLAVVVPKKADMRLPIRDLSEAGIGFELDTGDNDELADFPLKQGESLDIQFYLNQTLYIPLTVTVVRLETEDSRRKIGAQFKEKSKGFQAILAFLKFFDQVAESGHLKKR